MNKETNRTGDEILRLEQVAAGYGNHRILENISFSLHAGEILCLIGPNGAGKSTLLKTLTRELEPQSGKILLRRENGEQAEITGISSREISRRTAVMTTERISPELVTCREMVGFGRYPYTGRLGFLTPEDRKVVEETMAQLKLSELADRDFRELSDGQKQMVLFARAISQEPALLILDEPTSYLDIHHKLDMLTQVRHLAKVKNIAIILSLHEIDLAAKIADYVLCIDNGSTRYYGTPEEVITKEHLKEIYQLTPEMMEFLT